MSEIKLCEKCGEEAHTNDTYCAYCGANLKIQKNAWNNANIPIDNSNLVLNGRFLDTYFELTSKLNDLEKIDSGFEQHQLYFNRLSSELQSSHQNVNEFHLTTQKELKDVEDLKKLSWKSIKAGLKGNKEEKLKQEEIEYLNALNREESLKRDVAELQKRYDIAKSELDQLAALKKQKYELNIQLTKLIDQVCEGVPDPIEDKIEAELEQLKKKKAQFQPNE